MAASAALLLVTALCVTSAAWPRPPPHNDNVKKPGAMPLVDAVEAGHGLLTPPVREVPPQQPGRRRDDGAALCPPGFGHDALGMCREQW